VHLQFVKYRREEDKNSGLEGPLGPSPQPDNGEPSIYLLTKVRRSHNMDSEHWLLSEGWIPVRNNQQQILVFCVFGDAADPRGLQRHGVWDALSKPLGRKLTK
jgi:hypothetical protein